MISCCIAFKKFAACVYPLSKLEVDPRSWPEHLPFGKGSRGIGRPLKNMCHRQKMPIPSLSFQYTQKPFKKFARGLPVTSDTLARGLPR
jgi:hypothetical protein